MIFLFQNKVNLNKSLKFSYTLKKNKRRKVINSIPVI